MPQVAGHAMEPRDHGIGARHDTPARHPPGASTGSALREVLIAHRDSA